MQLHQISPKIKSRKRKRIGRGGKRGTYSGKGVKGQKSRAGRRFPPAVRELIKRYPKLRGYRFKGRNSKLSVVNMGDIEKKFKASETVSPEALLEKGLVRRIKGRVPEVKILGQGELKKKFIFEKCQFSKTAQEKIKKAGKKVIS